MNTFFGLEEWEFKNLDSLSQYHNNEDDMDVPGEFL